MGLFELGGSTWRRVVVWCDSLAFSGSECGRTRDSCRWLFDLAFDGERIGLSIVESEVGSVDFGFEGRFQFDDFMGSGVWFSAGDLSQSAALESLFLLSVIFVAVMIS